jgi:hypothetical protein
MFLWEVCIHLQVHVASQPGRPHYKYAAKRFKSPKCSYSSLSSQVGLLVKILSVILIVHSMMLHWTYYNYILHLCTHIITRKYLQDTIHNLLHPGPFPRQSDFKRAKLNNFYRHNNTHKPLISVAIVGEGGDFTGTRSTGKFLDDYYSNCLGKRIWEGSPRSHLWKPPASACHITLLWTRTVFTRVILRLPISSCLRWMAKSNVPTSSFVWRSINPLPKPLQYCFSFWWTFFK